MFINGCSCCGKCGCQCGKLPFTMTVGFEGLSNKAKGNFCDLTITANYGSGAAGVATLPGGCNGSKDPLCYDCTTDKNGKSDRGPLAGVLLTEPGSCYAKLGRVAPSLSATYDTGTGATFTANLAQHQDGLGLDYWSVSSISVTGGTGYQTGGWVRLHRAVGDTMQEPTVAYLVSSNGIPTGVVVVQQGKYYREDYSAPTYAADVTVTPCGGGTNAKIDAVVDTNNKSSTFGQITSLSVTNGGSNYLAWPWLETCRTLLNGESFVLRASDPEELTKIVPSSCFGGGFCGRIVPVGKTEKLCDEHLERTYEYDNSPTPVKAVEIINNGSGYALLGREEPSIKIEPAGGSFGTGATFSPTFSKQEDDCGVHYWTLESVAVTDGGECFGRMGRSQPTFTIDASGLGDIVLSPVVESATDECGAPYWYISAVNVNDFSGGHTDGTPLVTTSDGYAETEAVAVMREHDEEGLQGFIESIEVTNGGRYYIRGNVTEALGITLSTPEDKEQEPALLRLYTEGGEATKVAVLNKGRYYRENKALPPYVADVTLTIDQAAGSDGSGAVIEPTIDTDAESPSFGWITSLEVVEEGSDYTLYGGPKDCKYYGPCGIGLEFRGPDKEPHVTLCDAVYRATSKVNDCNSLPTEAVLLHSEAGGSVSLTAGGQWNSLAPCPCECGCARPNPDPCIITATNDCQPCLGPCGGCNYCDPGCECENGICVPKSCHCISTQYAYYEDGASYRCRFMRGGAEVFPGDASDFWVNEIPYGYLTIGGGFGPCTPPGDGYGPIFTWKENYPAALNSACGFILVWESATTACSGTFTVPVNGVLVTVFVGLARGKGRLRMFLPNCEDLTLEEVDITEVADWAVDENGDPIGLYFGCTGGGTGFSYDTGEPQCPQFDNGCPCIPEEPQLSDEPPVTIECGINI